MQDVAHAAGRSGVTVTLLRLTPVNVALPDAVPSHVVQPDHLTSPLTILPIMDTGRLTKRLCACLGITLALCSWSHGQCGQWVSPPGASLIGGASTSTRTMSSWDPDGPGPANPVLAVGGEFGGGCLAAWEERSGSWDSLGGLGTKYSMAVVDNDLYVAGRTVSGSNRLLRVQWDPRSTTDVFLSPSGFAIYSLAIFQNELVAGGTYQWTPTLRDLVKWNGTTPSGFSPTVNGAVSCVGTYNGSLIVAGSFSAVGGVAVNRIARWDGNTWSQLGAGITGEVRAMIEFNGSLFVAGLFTQAGGAPASNIATWDGQNWSSDGGSGFNGAINALALFRGQLIAGGQFSQVNGVPLTALAAYSPLSQQWTGMGSNLPMSVVYSLTNYNGSLYAGGNRYLPENTSIARWVPDSPPAATPPTASAVSFIGQDVTIEVVVSEESLYVPEGLQVQWLRNGIPVVDGLGGAGPGGGIVTGAARTMYAPAPVRLMITDVRAGDVGEYSVGLSNLCGSLQSEPIAVSLCIADFNGQGGISVQDVFDMLAAYFSGDPHADINASADLTVQDIFAFLAAYFAGCT